MLAALETLVEPTSRSDPESPLRWTCKGVRRLAAELQRQNFQIGRQKVADLLRDLDESLLGNRKTREGNEHPDRHAQFEHIAATIADFQSRGESVISVDTKQKELVGPFQDVPLRDTNHSRHGVLRSYFLLPVALRHDVNEHHVMTVEGPVTAADQNELASRVQQVVFATELLHEREQLARGRLHGGRFDGSHSPEQAHSPGDFRMVG